MSSAGGWLPLVRSTSGAVAIAITAAAFLNAFAYVMVVSIPLPQSDNWLFLDGFLGDFIEHGFSWQQLFAQASASNTNLPLYKLFLFFHTRYFGMDFRLEGILGIVCAGLMLPVLARAASGRGLEQWRIGELWLLAGLALVTFSLNSTNIYTWPLATQWYLTLLVAVLYLASAPAWQRWHAASVGASFMLGVLLDEVAYPVIAAALVAQALSIRRGKARAFLTQCAAVVAGLAASRFAYAFAPGGHEATATAGHLGTLLSAQLWKAAFYPLGDALVHVDNLRPLFGAVWPGMALGALLVLAQVAFWWRCWVHLRRGPDSTVLLAASVMLLCYALVLGVVLQRVSVFGFDYLHQPRYVMYYQLDLVALLLLGYREWRAAARAPRWVPALAALLFVFVVLQLRLSALAWEHAKYVTRYTEGAALSLGKLAAHPDAQLQCADILTVCNFPVAQRRRVLGLLVAYRLNLFSPDFQAFHRLHPAPPGDPASATATP